MKKTKYTADGWFSDYETIANTRLGHKQYGIAATTEDGFIPLEICSRGITSEIANNYFYNKEGKVKSYVGGCGKELKLYANKFKAKRNGNVYEFYMPKNSILASRVDPLGDYEDDIIFDHIKDVCKHFECNYATIRSCIKKSGLKSFKGYYFEEHWPIPYITTINGRKK